MTTMPIKKYIERLLIDEYADKDPKHGYSLDVVNLPPYELHNFLDYLTKNDAVTRELILDRMQELVNQVLPLAESRDLYGRGFIPMQDQTNGEVNWIARRGAA